MAIDWHPVAELPNALKDGREVLLWAGDIAATEIASFEGELWVNRDGATIRAVTYYTEITPP